MQNQEIQQSEERKPSLNWNKWDAIFFLIIAPFIILATFVIIAPMGGISYLSGRFNYPLDFLAVCLFVIWMVYPLMIVITIFIFLVTGFSFVFIGTARLISNWNKYTNKKRLIRIIQIGISILVITVLSLPLFISVELYSPGYKPFTYGFRDRIKSKADIPAILDWLKTLSKEDCTGDTIDLFSDPVSFKSYWPDSIEWPKSLKVFNPHYVNLDLDENGNPKVRLTWGGALGHWGVEIGMEDMKIPPSDFSRWGEYRLPVESGVYVWHEIQ